MWRFHDVSVWWIMARLLFFALFWGGLIYFGIWVVRKLSQGGNSAGDKGTSSALEIAKQRYARGEISKPEFEEIKKNIT